MHLVPPHLQSQVLRWRWSVFVSMFVGWSCHMFIRRTLPSSTSSLIKHQGFSREEIGMIASSFASAYGVSKFLGSIISDHVSPRKVFSCGLVLGGVCSVIFPNAWYISMACAVWFSQGLVQGLGWPPCVILLKSWYPPSQIGRWWSILSSAGNVTGALIPFIVLYCTSYIHWSFCFYFFGITAIVTGIVVLFFTRDSPAEVVEIFTDSSELHNHRNNKDMGTTATVDKEAEKLNEGTAKTESNDSGATKGSQSSSRWYSAFLVPNLWVVSAVYTILYLVSSSSQNWPQYYFVQEVGMSETSAATCFSMFQVGAIVGNFVAGFISDMLVTPKTLKSPCPRAPFLLGVALLLILFLHMWRTTVIAGVSELWSSTVMFGIGFLVFSGVAVVGLCAMDVVEPHLVGSAHGLACAVAQVGSFLGGWPFSLIVESYNWNIAYLMVELAVVVMAILCLYLVLLLVFHLRKQKED